MRCARTGTEDSAGPPHYVGPLPFREPMPAPPSVPARAKSLRYVAMPETVSDVLQGETALTHVVMVTHAV